MKKKKEAEPVALPTEIPAFYYNENATLDGVTLFRGKSGSMGWSVQDPYGPGRVSIPKNWGNVFARDALGRVWVLRRNRLALHEVAGIDIPPLAAALGVTRTALRRHISALRLSREEKDRTEQLESLQRMAAQFGMKLIKDRKAT